MCARRPSRFGHVLTASPPDRPDRILCTAAHRSSVYVRVRSAALAARTRDRFWLGLQSDYDLGVAADELGERLEREGQVRAKAVERARQPTRGSTRHAALAGSPRGAGRAQIGAVVAFDELELKRIERTVGVLCRKSSPPEHADQLRTVYEVEGHTVTMYEERPPWDGVGEWTRRGIARFRFYRSRREWRPAGCARTCAGTSTNPMRCRPTSPPSSRSSKPTSTELSLGEFPATPPGPATR